MLSCLSIAATIATIIRQKRQPVSKIKLALRSVLARSATLIASDSGCASREVCGAAASPSPNGENKDERIRGHECNEKFIQPHKYGYTEVHERVDAEVRHRYRIRRQENDGETRTSEYHLPRDEKKYRSVQRQSL